MPRLSLYKPERGKDFEFLDRQILEMFTIGGTDLFVHKYLGPDNPDEADATADQPRYDAVKETNIQDLLFLENRDRKYDPDVYTMRGVYNVQDVDFDLSQFGLFLQNLEKSSAYLLGSIQRFPCTYSFAMPAVWLVYLFSLIIFLAALEFLMSSIRITIKNYLEIS